MPSQTTPIRPQYLDQGEWPRGNEYTGEASTDPGQEIEDNIRQLQMSQKTALQLIAGALQALKYGEMMQLAQELKALVNGGGQPDTPAGIAALLHTWALKHGSIDVPQTTASEKPTTTTTASADLLPKTDIVQTEEHKTPIPDLPHPDPSTV